MNKCVWGHWQSRKTLRDDCVAQPIASADCLYGERTKGPLSVRGYWMYGIKQLYLVYMLHTIVCRPNRNRIGLGVFAVRLYIKD